MHVSMEKVFEQPFSAQSQIKSPPAGRRRELPAVVIKYVYNSLLSGLLLGNV